MSDPVTNVDVEDVLSSIRRLVSETKPDNRQETKEPETGESAPADVPQDAAKPAEALILTSALRVDAPAKDSVPEFRHTDMPNFRHILSGDTPAPTADSTAETTENRAEWSTLANDDYYEDDVQPEASSVITFIPHSRASKSKKPAAVFSDEDKSWEPEFVAPTEDEDEARQGALVEEPISVAATSAEVDSGAKDNVWDLEQDAPDADASQVDDEILDQNAVDDTAPVEKPVEVDDELEDTLAVSSVFASEAAASVMEDTTAPDEDHTDPEKALADTAASDEGVIDEEALRDLVAEIVRQELTGELGERITRNVRKLVRREIHRALLTREFD